MMILLAWTGDQAAGLKLLAKCLQVPDGAEFQHMGGRATFEIDVRKLLESRALLEQKVDLQIAAFGVQDLPVSNLLR